MRVNTLNDWQGGFKTQPENYTVNIVNSDRYVLEDQKNLFLDVPSLTQFK